MGERFEERSSLWGIGAVGAATAGLGYSLYKGRNEMLSALKVNIGDSIREIQELSKNSIKFASPRGSSVLNQIEEAAIDRLSDDYFKVNTPGISSLGIDTNRLVSTDIAQTAYESLLSGGKVGEKEALAAYHQILKQENRVGAYKEAVSIIGKEGSGADFDVFNKGMSAITDPTSSKYSISRLEAAANMTTVSSDYNMKRLSVDFNLLDKASQERAQRIQASFGGGANLAEMGTPKYFEVAAQLGGKEVKTPMMSFTLAGQKINMPLADTGLTFSGDNLTTQYALKQAYDETGRVESYASRMEREIGDVIRKGTSDPGKEIQDIINNITRDLSDRDNSQAIHMMPEQALTTGGKAKRNIIMNQAIPSFEADNIDFEGNIKAGLTPIGSSKSVGTGNAFISKPGSSFAQEIFGDVGEAFPIEKRPDQFVRSEFGLTKAAIQAAKEAEFKGDFGRYAGRFDSLFNGERAAEILGDYRTPNILTYYAKPATTGRGNSQGYASEALNQALGSEEVVVRDKVADMLEAERITQKRIKLDRGLAVNKNVLSTLEGLQKSEVGTWGDVAEFSGDVGIEKDTGRVFSTGRNSSVMGARWISDTEAIVYIREKAKISADEWQKMFGMDVKAMAHTGDDSYMASLLSSAGETGHAGTGSNSTMYGQKVEAMMTAKQLKKNNMARLAQQTEAMTWIASNKLDSMSKEQRYAALGFLQDKSQFLKMDLKEGMYPVADADALMVEKARAMGFGEVELGHTFGMMDADRATGLGIGKAVEASTGVLGFSKMHVGNLAGDYVGQTATMDASGFRTMAARGGIHRDFAIEMAGRLKGKEGFSKIEQSLASMVNNRSIIDKVKERFGFADEIEDITKLDPQKLIGDEDKFVSLGGSSNSKVASEAMGGTDRIFIPGRKSSPELYESFVSDGKVMKSQFEENLLAFQNKVAHGSTETTKTAAAGLINETNRLYQSKGIAAGEVIGSEYLTGIRRTGSSQAAMANVYEMNKRTGLKMYERLLASAPENQKSFIQEQMKQWIAGDELTGGVWRQPTTGPESFQFTKIKMNDNLADDIVQAPQRWGTMTLGEEKFGIDMSPAVGQKGDFDKDMFALTAIGDEKNYNSASKYLQEKAASEYDDFLFKNYALQDAAARQKKLTATVGAVDGPVTKMAAGAAQLAETSMATGMVNESLSRLKMGLYMTGDSSLQASAKILEELEQTAIDKHSATGPKMFEQLGEAVRSGDAKRVSSVLRNTWGDAKTFTGSINGKKMSWDWNPDVEGEKFANAYKLAENDVVDEMMDAKVGRGKKIMSVAEIQESLNRRATGTLDPAKALMYKEGSKFSSISESANRAFRSGAAKASAFGKAFNKVKGPALLGAAVAAGVMMMAPSVSGTLNIKKEGTSGGRTMGPEDIGPAGAGMNPPPPRMMNSPRTYDLSGIKQSSRANINVSMNDVDASANFRKHMGQMSNARVRTRDDRSVLDPQRLANKIQERL